MVETTAMTQSIEQMAREIIDSGYAKPWGRVVCGVCYNHALQGIEAGIRLGREHAAAKLDEWQDTPTLLLACGEMTAQEIRTVKAVLRQRAKIIREIP
jgi:hypothetical protein